MSKSDLLIIFTCDDCGKEIKLNANYSWDDQLEDNGWLTESMGNDTHYCVTCKEKSVKAFCDKCGWEGKPEDCQTYIPDYEEQTQFAICPACGYNDAHWLRRSEL